MITESIISSSPNPDPTEINYGYFCCYKIWKLLANMQIYYLSKQPQCHIHRILFFACVIIFCL